MAHIILVHPPVEFIGPDGHPVQIRPQLYPPLGLAYLASSLEAAGHQAAIIDANALNLHPDMVAQKIGQAAPDWVGFYCSSFNLRQVRATIRLIRESCHARIVVGGPHITHRPQAVRALGADVGIRGDAEQALPELLSNPDRIGPGVVTADQDRPETVTSVYPKDLNTLPAPARHLLPERLYYTPASGGRMATIITARGCTSRCNFCDLPHRPYHARAVPSVLDEMEALFREGVAYVDFHDPTFSFSRRRTLKLMDGILARGIRMKWGAETRADRLDADLVALMKRAGCVNLRFGIEAGAKRVRNEIVGKNLEEADILRAFALCKSQRIETMAFFLLGHPSETLAEMQQTLALAKRLKPTYADFSIPVPLPGSDLFRRMVAEKRLSEDIWEQVIDDAPLPLHVPQGLDLDTLSTLRRKAYRRQYLTLRQIAHQLGQIKSPGDLINRVRAAITVLGASQRKKPVIW